MEILVLATGQ